MDDEAHRRIIRSMKARTASPPHNGTVDGTRTRTFSPCCWHRILDHHPPHLLILTPCYVQYERTSVRCALCGGGARSSHHAKTIHALSFEGILLACIRHFNSAGRTRKMVGTFATLSLHAPLSTGVKCSPAGQSRPAAARLLARGNQLQRRSHRSQPGRKLSVSAIGPGRISCPSWLL